jgi:hypothetical protein
MSEAVQQQVEGLKGLLEDLSDAYELRYNSAHAAAAELVQNWEAALHDGASLTELSGDVDLVIGLLQKFKQDTLALDLSVAPAPVR